MGDIRKKRTGNTILRSGGVYSWRSLSANPQETNLIPDSRPMGDAIKRGSSQNPNARLAVAELCAQLEQADPALVVFFCSAQYDRKELAAAMSGAFPGGLVVGCTTAGEITPFGYRSGSLTGISISRAVCHAEAVLFDKLGSFAFSHGLDAVRSLHTSMAEKVGDNFTARSFAMLLVDGLSGAEDSVLSALHAGLADIPLFGGSAGDNLAFRQTFVFKDGAFCSDAAVLVLIHTALPFRVFKTQHFIGSDTKMVITGADPVQRIVTEINAEPAGREFARMVGMEMAELSPMVFASHPVVVRVGGADYVRSIQKVNADGSLSFFCAIDEGLVLSVGQSIDPYENLRQVFEDIETEIGRPQLILGCECVLRQLEMERCHLKEKMGALLAEYEVVGFNTYGEQFNAMHVNQTFTGVALSCPKT